MVIFLLKNVSSFCKSYSHFFSKNICELDIVLTRTVNILTTNELVKLKTLWTTGPSTEFLFWASSWLPFIDSIRGFLVPNLLSLLPLMAKTRLIFVSLKGRIYHYQNRVTYVTIQADGLPQVLNQWWLHAWRKEPYSSFRTIDLSVSLAIQSRCGWR